MENNAVAGAGDMPAGVTKVGEAAAPAAPVEPVVEQTTAPDPDTQVMEEGGAIKDWNAVEILGMIVVTTIFFFAITYFRTKTLIVDEEIKKHDNKLQRIESDVEQLKTPII